MSLDPTVYADDPALYTRAVMVSLLVDHYGHHIEIALYGNSQNPNNAAIECTDCSTVLADWDHPWTESR